MSTPNQPEGRYAARGVSATKTEVHAAVDQLDRGLYPGAFCKIIPDHLSGDPDRCCVIHADGSGTKSTLAYLHWRETGDATAFRGISQDSIVMNIDDLLCVGVTGNIIISSTINRNARNIPGDVLAQLIQSNEAVLENLRSHGFSIHSGGGETADVGDLTPTCTVDSCAVATLPRKQVIDGSQILPGLAIVGLASNGQATYETFENSGIGSNGLTSARHDMLCSYYREKYPETCDSGTDPSLLYCGKYKLEDPLPGSRLTVGEALRSPTRTYAPVVVALLQAMPEAVRGLIHCSGGGQTKCLRFGQKVHHVKDNLFAPPPIFAAIQEASGTTDHEMHQVYNMGHRLEVYCPPEQAQAVIELASTFGIPAQTIGRTEPSQHKDGQNHVSILREGKEVLEYCL